MDERETTQSNHFLRKIVYKIRTELVYYNRLPVHSAMNTALHRYVHVQSL